jgi:ATP-dependent DNA helicase RecQ
LEWLAEWGRDIRRRQQGLLLLTAHRAKGLEFDHVAVLDGGWDRVGNNEDPDAPRRLYYVAMTRARQTLAVAHFDGSRGFQVGLQDHPATIRRETAELPPSTEAVSYHHVSTKLQDVDIGYAGRQHGDSPIHDAISELSIGDLLTARIAHSGRWELLDTKGRRVGRLAQSFKPPSGMRCRSAEVFAVVSWSREASEPEYRNTIRCEAWEVVVPEFVFKPEQS